MEISNKLKTATLWVLALSLPIFWHTKAQNPFLFSKELFFRFYIILLLGVFLWPHNKFFSVLLIYSLGFTFLKLSTRSLWALGNLRDFLTGYLIIRVFLEKINWKHAFYGYLISLYVIIAVSIAQIFNLDITQHGSDLFYNEYWKVAGFFGNSHILKTWLGICAPLNFLLPRKLIPGGLLVTLGALIAITLIHPGLGGLAIALMSCGIVILILRRKTFLAYALIPITAILCTFNHSNAVRFEIIRKSIPFIKKHPIIGNGLNSFGEAGIKVGHALELQAHNEFLQFIFEYGFVIGCAAIIAFIAYYAISLTKIKVMKTRAILSGIFYGFLLYDAFSFPFHMTHTAVLFLTIIATIDSINENPILR